MSTSKTAGYTHHWRFLPRFEGYDIEVPSHLIDECHRLKAQADKMVVAAEDLQRKVQRGSNLYRGEDGIDSIANPINGYRTDKFYDWLDKVSRKIESWKAEAERNKDRPMIRMAASTLSDISKAKGALARFEKTWDKHWMAYKGKPATGARAAVNFANMSKAILSKIDKTMEAFFELEGGFKSSLNDFGFLDNEWKKLVAEAQKIVTNAEHQGIAIRGPDGNGRPIINQNIISLNGDAQAEKEGGDREVGESFELTQHPYHGHSDWCKTYQRPYDAVVVSILAAAKKIAPDALEVRSDGGASAIKRVLGSREIVGAGFEARDLDLMVKERARGLGLNPSAAEADAAVFSAATPFFVKLSTALGIALQQFPPVNPDITVADLLKQGAFSQVFLSLGSRSGKYQDQDWMNGVWDPGDRRDVVKFLGRILRRQYNALEDAVLEAALQSAGE